jgi:CheY-like chemotaxis protein
MLRRLIGEDIELAWLPGHELWSIRIDPSQVDQILANLAVNARDAIHGVGKVTIETRSQVLDGACCAGRPGLVPGEYVILTVSDTGVGMGKDVLQYIFEPFFTTKEVGKGTGLGLATVYGIVKQNGGFINVTSEAGRGTTFTICFPRFLGETPNAAGSSTDKPLGGTETILLVEDEESILNLGQRMLDRLGYKVLSASTPHEAIRLVQEYRENIHLLITDVVMPQMNGRELAERLTALKPTMKCLFMSGYTADAIAHHGVLDEGVRFIQKPFSIKTMAEKTREALTG